MSSVPDTPTLEPLEQTGDGVVRVTITPALTGDPATSYSIFYKTSTSPTWDMSLVTVATITDISGLTPATEYTFAVTAVNAIGSSTESTTRTITIVPPTLPPTITDISANDESVGIIWTDVSYASSYTIYYKVSSSTTYDLSSSGITGTSYVITGLTNRTEYSFTIAGNNVAGQGSLSTPVTAQPIAPPPTNLAASGRIRAIDISWSAVANATNYTVYRTLPTAPDVSYNITAPSTTLTVTNIQLGEPYQFSVTASISGIESAASTPVVATAYTPEYATIYDITADNTYAYTSGRALGDISYAALSGNPYITATSLADGTAAWTREYTDLSYTSNVIVTTPSLIVGIDLSAQRINAFDISGGAPVWSLSAPAPAELFYDVSADHIHVVGRFSGVYNPGGSAQAISSDTNDAYLLTVDMSGSPTLARNITASIHGPTSTLQMYPTCVTVGGADHITYVGGTFTGIGTDLSASEAYNASFIMAVDDSGNIFWIRSIDADFLDNLYDIEFRDGRIYICGSYHHRERYLAFDEIIALPASPDDAGEGYVAALDTSGTYLWVQKIGCDISGTTITEDQSLIRGITIDASGRIFFAGDFVDNPVILDVSGSPVNIPYTNTGRNGFFGEMTMITVPPSAPLPPIDVSATSLSLNAITVSWSPDTVGGPARSFKLFYKTEYDTTFTQFVNTYDLSYTFTSLISSLNYQFAVSAVGPGGISTASATVTARPLSSVPQPPTDISANPSNGATKVTWASSFDTYYYTLYLREQGNTAWDISVSPIYTLNYTQTGLTNGLTYEVALSATNQEGEGAKSTPVTVIPALSTPTTPTGIAIVTGDSTISITWDADPDATAYQVYYRLSSAAPGDPYDMSSVTVPAFIGQFPNGVAYDFYLTASSALGTSEPTAIRTATAAVPVPEQPQFFLTAADYSAELYIVDVSYATSYIITQALSGDIVYVASNPATVVAPANGTLTTLLDLSNNVTYDIKVVASGPGGTSTAYNYQQVTPFAPQPATPELADPVKVSETAVDLSWSAVSPGNTTEYRVYYGLTANSPVWDASAVILGPATTTTITGLTTGETYDFAVTAFGRGGESAMSLIKTIAVNAYPAAPSDISATVVDGTTINVTWSAAPAALSYTFYYRNPGAEWTEVALDSSTLNISIPGTYNVTYEFSVSVLTADGHSALATPIQITVPFPLPDAPSVGAVAGDGFLDVSWSPVIYSYAYTVQATPTGLGPGYVAGSTPDISLSTTDISATLAAVNGVEYSLTVTAVGVSGSGPASSPITVLPLPPLPSAPAAAPTLVASTGTIRVAWEAVERADSYVVLWTGGGSVAVSGQAARQIDISGLTNNFQYEFQVAAVNYAGQGPASATAAATPRVVPAAPTGLAAAAADGYVDLSWSAVANATGYKIYIGDEEAGTVVLPFVIVNALTNGRLYTFKVAAFNVDVDGPLSAAVESIPAAPGTGSVAVVEPPAEVKTAVLNVLGPGGAVNEADQALFDNYLDGIISGSTSEVIVDTGANRTVGAFAAADIARRKELAPDEPLMTDSRANITDLTVPDGTAAVIVNLLPVGVDTVNLGSVTEDVVLDVQRYDASKALIPSVNFDTTTYTRVVFERDISAVNVYRLIAGEPFLMITLDIFDAAGKGGAYDCSGSYLGQTAAGKYRFSYFGPFSYTIITGLTPTASVPCLVAGTAVMCPGGAQRLVDDLRAGDLVLCDDGRAVPVKAVYVTRFASATEKNAPVIIPRGYCGLAADVVISDCHAVKCRDGWLIPRVAERRAGRELFERSGVGSSVTYYHIEMPNYLRDNLVTADGVCVESFGRTWAATQPESVLRGLWRLNSRGLLDRMSGSGTTKAAKVSHAKK